MRSILIALLLFFVVVAVAGSWFGGTQGKSDQVRAVASSSVPSSLPALAKNTAPCRKGVWIAVCYVKFGQGRVQLEDNKDRSLKRAVVFSNDMKRDAQDFTLAAGFLMMTINPQSLPDERGNLLQRLMVAGNKGVSTKWSGYAWQLAYASNDAIRIIAAK